MMTRLFRSKAVDLGIDLGTSNTRVVDGDGNILFDQPSLCCFKGYNAAPSLVAVGAEARHYQAKIARPLKIIHPLEHGVLSDMPAARELLKFARKSAGMRRKWRMRPAIGVPADATQAERRALVAAAADAGFVDPLLVEEPLLAARGLNVDLSEPHGHLIVDCGGGAIDVAVVSLGGICVSETMRAGGLALDRAIVDHLHLAHRFQIGPRSAEQLKLDISQAFHSGEDPDVSVRGLDMASGLPKALTLPASEFRRLWTRFVRQAVAIVREALGRTPPELARDVLNGGIQLTGGAAQTAMLAKSMSEKIGVEVVCATEPARRVAKGLASFVKARVAAPSCVNAVAGRRRNSCHRAPCR
jgi:rod shape-determining protein MreB